jgi:acyl carrier protein
MPRSTGARGRVKHPSQSPSRIARLPPLWHLKAFSVSESHPISSISAVSVPDLSALELELAELFVQALNLELRAEEINPADSLFGEGLGLDSIDILEVALEVSHRYGFQLRSDDENNHQIFRSLRSLAAHVALHRTK